MKRYEKSDKLMETGNRFKNGGRLKSRMSRGNWKLFTLFILLASVYAFSSCEKEKKDDNTKLPEYIALDQNLGNQIDYAILGLDGSGYFYEFQDENPNIPQRLSIYDGNKSNLELVINFDKEGLPKNILSENFTIVLGKYEENRFNAVVITKEGESQIFENIETDISWDEYKNGISGVVSRALFQMRASVSYNSIIKGINKVVGVVGCGLSIASTIAAAPTGIGAVIGWGLTSISCGSAFVNLGQGETPESVNEVSKLGNYASLMICAQGIADKLQIWSCVTTLVNWILSDVSNKENSATKDIKSGEDALNNNSTIDDGLTITSPSYGATYRCGDWIDIFVRGYTGADWQDYLELQYWCLVGEPQPNNTNEPSTYFNKAYTRKEAAYSFTFSPETPSVWEGHWVKLVAINKKNNTQSAPQYIRVIPPNISDNINGVVINGVRWATRNVDAPGTFTSKPENASMYYQWNRKLGWSATDPMINSNGGTVWDSSLPSGTKWEKANDPSPSGWRVPTLEEMEKLSDLNNVIYVWTTVNGVIGGRITDRINGNTIFLPAIGSRDLYNGSLSRIGTHGMYWSGSQYNSLGSNYTLDINTNYVRTNGLNSGAWGLPVRCVAE